MKIKKLSAIVAAVAITASLAGCTAGGAKLPEGDVKIVNQQVQGVVELLLESANYGEDKSTVASMVLPKDSQYDVSLYVEKYSNGELSETKELTKYTTETIEKDSIVHIIMNTAKSSDGEADKSIYSIAEVDKENTKDAKNPEYKITKTYGESIDFDSKSEVSQIGKNLDEEITLIGLVKFKDDDSEKATINLDSYKDEIGKYASVNIIKVKVTKK
ncbi:hypothetical protein NSA50_14980 [Clostridium sp. DSM 100503]|uniref:hypothetical protein n=1 Tax=Clostridium sp. DSM 100503 TaxID=2963282 RepID=UPI00214A4AAF|nr:hypothetical protein [Clostridium sp. DSM 100503]MCR1952331.1 hypothetical protein [Clostridium sp. DSM 100503]